MRTEPLALWQDTYLVVGALILTAHRAAAFLGPKDAESCGVGLRRACS